MILGWTAFTARTVEAVTEFHRAFDRPIGDPGNGAWRIRRTRLAEEHAELVDAVNRQNLLATADALADLSYVLAGTAVVYGTPHTVLCSTYGPTLRSSQPALTTFDTAFDFPPTVDIWTGRFTTTYGQYYVQSAGGQQIDPWTLVRMQHAVASIAVVCGIPLEAMFEEVHRSNMSKTPPARLGLCGDGKAVKGAGYQPPDLAAALTAYHVRPIVRDLLAQDTEEGDTDGHEPVDNAALSQQCDEGVVRILPVRDR